MQSDRNFLRKTLQRIFRRRQQKRQRVMRQFEIMESRVLLAADLHVALQDPPMLELHGEFSSIETVIPVAEGEGAIVAEGEAAQDLVAFAKALADSGTRFYGAAWCPHCTATKELFEDGADFLPFIEVTNLDSPVTLNAVGDGTNTALNPSGVPITSFPTWEFPDGTRLEGELSLATISQRSGVAIPSSDTPFIAPIRLVTADVDADGIRDDIDDDFFNDGVPNSQDDDFDNDGIANDQDPDIDGDGVNELNSSGQIQDGFNDRNIVPRSYDADGDEIITLLGGSPLHISLDGYDPGGGPLTYTVTSSDPSFVAATLLQNNRSMVIDVAGWGKMNFQLFEQRAERPTSRLIDLATTGDYDASSTTLASSITTTTATTLTVADGSVFPNSFPFDVQIEAETLRVTAITGNVLTVVRGIDGTTAAAHNAAVNVSKIATPIHRVVNGFVIQGGDITNRDGTGGSNRGDFDDQFHVDLQHNRAGVLSYAKSSDDTNDSQFFITEGPTRSLDGNHSVAGILVEGDKNREAISNNSTLNPRTIVMNSVDIFTDTENAVVMLTATPGATGTATITVTATDAGGNQFSREFTVNVEPDVVNTLPWLGEVSEIKVPTGQSSSFQFPIIDVEGDLSQFGVVAPTNFTIAVPTGGVTSMADLTITPNAGFVGQETITFWVADADLNTSSVTITDALLQSNSTLFDVQSLTVEAEASTTDGMITGTVFADTDRDGVLDTGETGLSGFTVFSDANNNGVVDPGEITATTALDGTYSLTLPPGQHTIRQLEVADFLVTTDNPITLNLQSGGSFTDVRFGNFDVVAPTSIDLLAATDSGNDSDNITNFNNSAANRALQFQVGGVVDDAIVRLFADGVLIGQAMANGGATITTNGSTTLTNGTHSIIATQEVDGVQGPAGSALSITIDAAAPGAFTSTPPTGAIVDNDISYDANSTDEGNGVTYSLSNPPAGATIDAATGFISWAPTASQLGQRNFSVVATDVAGNTTTQPLSIRVTNQPLIGASYKITADSNPDSAELGEVNVGDTFFLHVSVTDLRDNALGTFAFYEDIVFDSQLASATNITYSPTFPNVRSGTRLAGEIDEVGAVNFDTNGVGAGTFHMFSVEFQATRSGTLNLVGNAPDVVPAHDVLLLGISTAIPADDVLFGAAQLTINPGFGAIDDIFNFDEDTTNITLDVLANDSSLSGSTSNLTITSISPQIAGVSIASDGKSLLYSPALNFNGEINFSYTLSDGVDDQTADVTVQIHPINDAPVAVNDTVSITAGTTNNFINVLANDTDIDGDQLRVQSVGQLTGNGTISVGSSGTGLNYTPGTGFTGTDTVTYTITDSRGGTSQATLTLNVTGAGGDTFTVDEGSLNNVFDVLQNDTGTGLTITAVGSTNQGGIVTITENATRLNYSRPANDNFFGNDVFTYTARASNGQISTATVIVTVSNTNDAPTAVNDTFVVTKGSPSTVLSVLANDTNAPDPLGTETLSVASVSNTNTIGTVALVNGNVRYVPPAIFPATGLATGTDTFTYLLTDGTGLTSQATVTVNVVDFVPASLSGFVYVDSDNDGVRDSGEEGFEGVTITLSGTDTFGSSVSKQTTTSSSGAYSFPGLAPGSYTITETQPTGQRNGVPIVDGKDTIGSQGGTASVNDQFSITLAEGTDGTNNNFGELLGRTLAGSLVRFTNSGERFGGLDVLLFEVNGDTSAGQSIALTNSAGGRFSYSGIAPDSYRLRAATPTFLLSNDANLVDVSVTSDADSTGNQVAVRGREAAFISLRDISTAAPTEYAHVAVGSTGQEWYSFGRGWESFTDANFTVTNGGANLHIEVTDATGQTLATDVARNDSRLRLLGQTNGLDLVQIMAGSASFNLQIITPANTNGASGEGSPVATQSAAAPFTTAANVAVPVASTVTTAPANTQPEGEASSLALGDLQISQPVVARPIQAPEPIETITAASPATNVPTLAIPTNLLPATTGHTVSLVTTSLSDTRITETTADEVTDETRATLLVEVANEYGDPFRYGGSGGNAFVPLEDDLQDGTEAVEVIPGELLEELALAVAAA